MTNNEQVRRAGARLRFVSAESRQTPGSRIDVSVTLALPAVGGEPEGTEQQYTGRASGVGADILEPRLAVEATLAAIAEATGDPDRFRLLGIKVVPAFDTRVVLVCLRSTDHPVKLVGSLPSRTHGDIAQTAAKATLSATNRLLAPSLQNAPGENLPETNETAPGI